MEFSNDLDRDDEKNREERHAFIRQWAAYVRAHDDETWSRQQNKLIDAQLHTANELARRGETDPVRFVRSVDRVRDRP